MSIKGKKKNYYKQNNLFKKRKEAQKNILFSPKSFVGSSFNLIESPRNLKIENSKSNENKIKSILKNSDINFNPKIRNDSQQNIKNSNILLISYSNKKNNSNENKKKLLIYSDKIDGYKKRRFSLDLNNFEMNKKQIGKIHLNEKFLTNLNILDDFSGKKQTKNKEKINKNFNINTLNNVILNNNNFNQNSENTLFFESPLLKNKNEEKKKNFKNQKVITSNETKNDIIQLISYLNNSNDYKNTFSSSIGFAGISTQNNVNNLNTNTNINTIPNSNNITNNNNTNLNTIENIFINTNLNGNSNENENKNNLSYNFTMKNKINSNLNSTTNFDINNYNKFKFHETNLLINVLKNNLKYNNKFIFRTETKKFQQKQNNSLKNSKPMNNTYNLENKIINESLKINLSKSSSFKYQNSNILKNHQLSPFFNDFININKDKENQIIRKIDEKQNIEENLIKKSHEIKYPRLKEKEDKYSSNIINIEELIQLRDKINLKNVQTSFLEKNNLKLKHNLLINSNDNLNSPDVNLLNGNLNYINKINIEELNENLNKNKEEINDEKRNGTSNIMMRNKYKNLIDKINNKSEKFI